MQAQGTQATPAPSTIRYKASPCTSQPIEPFLPVHTQHTRIHKHKHFSAGAFPWPCCLPPFDFHLTPSSAVSHPRTSKPLDAQNASGMPFVSRFPKCFPKHEHCPTASIPYSPAASLLGLPPYAVKAHLHAAAAAPAATPASFLVLLVAPVPGVERCGPHCLLDASTAARRPLRGPLPLALKAGLHPAAAATATRSLGADCVHSLP